MTDISHARPAGILARFRIYQRERFPLGAHGLSVAAFASASVACGHGITGTPAGPGWAAYAVASLVLFCQFFLLRVADEFKDADADARYRPERPVPRGLVSLDELLCLGAVAAILQFVCVLVFDARLLLFLGLIWLWFGLMSVEFFAREWLRERPLLYMISHMMILPLMTLFAMAAAVPEWSGFPPVVLSAPAAWIFCGLSLAAGALLEVGRKIRAPEEERPGVQTYTLVWGRRRALALWLLAALVTALLALWMVSLQGAWAGTGIVSGTGIFAMAILAMLHDVRPRSWASSAIESFSGLWVLILLFTLFLAYV